MERENPTRHLCHPPLYFSHPGPQWLLPIASSCLQSSSTHHSLACQAHFEEAMVCASHAAAMSEGRLATMSYTWRDDDGDRMKAVELCRPPKMGYSSFLRYSLTHVQLACPARFGEAVVYAARPTATLEDWGMPGLRARPAMMTCA